MCYFPKCVKWTKFVLKPPKCYKSSTLLIGIFFLFKKDDNYFNVSLVQRSYYWKNEPTHQQTNKPFRRVCFRGIFDELYLRLFITDGRNKSFRRNHVCHLLRAADVVSNIFLLANRYARLQPRKSAPRTGIINRTIKLSYGSRSGQIKGPRRQRLSLSTVRLIRTIINDTINIVKYCNRGTVL